MKTTTETTELEALSRYQSALDELKAEKAQLEERLARINQALGLNGTSRTLTHRPRNASTLREAVAELTKDKPLTKDEILEALPRTGYHSTSRNLRNVLNSLLYHPKTGAKRKRGRFQVKG